MSNYKTYKLIGLESDVQETFNAMVKESRLNKSDFLRVLINLFNEHDIRTGLLDRRIGETTEGFIEGSLTPVSSEKDTGSDGLSANGLSPSALDLPEDTEAC